MDDLQKILNYAMKMEKDAGNFYAYFEERVESESTKKLFSEFKGFEAEHYNMLRKYHDGLGYNDPPITISWVVDSNFAYRNPEIIANNADYIGEPGKNISDMAVMRTAYLMENDFEEFYKIAAEKVQDKSAKEFLINLSVWEKQHKDMFYARYQQLLREYWSDINSMVLNK